MNTEDYVYRIISSLKMKLNVENQIYRYTYKGEVVLSKVEFKEPLLKKDLIKIKEIDLPEDYLSFLKISNGAEFFIDDYHGSQAILKLYSLDEILKNKKFYLESMQIKNQYPIGILLDNSELLIDEEALEEGRDYLLLADGSKRFNYGFQEWLDKFIIAQGNEFWLLDYKYD